MRMIELAQATALSLLLGACASNQTTTTPSTTTSAAPVSTEIVFEVIASSLNVRAAPNPAGRVAGSVSRGEVLTAPYGETEGWVYIQSESGQTGYVATKYLRRISPEAATASTPSAPAATPAATPSSTQGTTYESKADPRLASIKEGMTSDQVIEILGQPTSQQNYVTGKAWIPYYYGTDTSRVDFKYTGVGRVIMSRNQYSGQLKVIRVEPDPSEDGH